MESTNSTKLICTEDIIDINLFHAVIFAV